MYFENPKVRNQFEAVPKPSKPQIQFFEKNLLEDLSSKEYIYIHIHIYIYIFLENTCLRFKNNAYKIFGTFYILNNGFYYYYKST